MLAYLMFFAALSNSVCLYNAFMSFFFAVDFCKCSLFSCFFMLYAQCRFASAGFS